MRNLVAYKAIRSNNTNTSRRHYPPTMVPMAMLLKTPSMRPTVAIIMTVPTTITIIVTSMAARERLLRAKLNCHIGTRSPTWDVPAKRQSVSSYTANALPLKFTVGGIAAVLCASIRQNTKNNAKMPCEASCLATPRHLIPNFPNRISAKQKNSNCPTNWDANAARVLA